jgi:hypothetical protein
MKITYTRGKESTAMITYRFDGVFNGEFQNIYIDYPIASTDSLRYIQAAAQEFILETEDKEEIYRAQLSILRSAQPAVLIPGWSYWFTVIALDEEEEGEEEPEEEEEEEEEEEGEE